MHPSIEAHLEAIRTLCREYGVRGLELFGSAATDAFDPERSDVEFSGRWPRRSLQPWTAEARSLIKAE